MSTHTTYLLYRQNDNHEKCTGIGINGLKKKKIYIYILMGEKKLSASLEIIRMLTYVKRELTLRLILQSCNQ